VLVCVCLCAAFCFLSGANDQSSQRECLAAGVPLLSDEEQNEFHALHAPLTSSEVETDDEYEEGDDYEQEEEEEEDDDDEEEEKTKKKKRKKGVKTNKKGKATALSDRKCVCIRTYVFVISHSVLAVCGLQRTGFSGARTPSSPPLAMRKQRTRRKAATWALRWTPSNRYGVCV
jgi:hypothetical protein